MVKKNPPKLGLVSKFRTLLEMGLSRLPCSKWHEMAIGAPLDSAKLPAS